MKPFGLEIITPEYSVFNGLVSSLIVPAYKGYMGVMAGHSSFIGALGQGKISFAIAKTEPHSESNKPEVTTDPDSVYLVKGGFIEVISKPFSMTKVSILAENISSLASR